MKSWQEFKIGDLCEVGRGSSPRPILDQKYFAGGDIPWIKIADATASGKYIYRTEEHVNEYGASFSRYLEPNSLIIAASGVSLGQIKFLGVKGCIHDGWLYASNYNDSLLKEYLYYYLKYYSKAFHKFSYGAAIQNINTEIFRNTKIKLPPLPIQQKIASILSAYDDLIENNKRRIQLLEEMAEEIYKEGFVRMRFPGYENAKFYDEAGQEVPHGTAGALPEGWEKVTLGTICNFNMGQSPSSNFYNELGDGLPFHQGVTNFNNRFPDHKIFCTDLKKTADEGEILLSVRAPVGRINIANTKIVIGRGICSITHKNKLNNYCYYLLKDIFKLEDSFGNGAVFNAVTKSELTNIKIIMPQNMYCSKFQLLIEPFDDEIEILTQKNKLLQETRDLLLPRLISGKLNVEQLLEKEENYLIAAEPEAQYQKQ